MRPGEGVEGIAQRNPFQLLFFSDPSCALCASEHHVWEPDVRLRSQ